MCLRGMYGSCTCFLCFIFFLFSQFTLSIPFLVGIADAHLHCLKSIQNVAVSLVSGARHHKHITPVLTTLHWLPVRQRVTFKTAVQVWKCLHDVVPCYLGDLCVPPAGHCESLSALFGAHCALDQDIDWPTQLCCLWPQNLEPTTASLSTARTVTNFIHVPAQDPHGSSSTSVLIAVASCTHVPSSGAVVTVVTLVPTTNILTQLYSTDSIWRLTEKIIGTVSCFGHCAQ